MAGIFKTKVIRPLRDRAIYWCLKSVFIFCRIVPRKMLLAWHGWLAVVIFNLSGTSREKILNQLGNVYKKEKNAAEIKKMGQEVYVHLGKTFTDYILFSHLTSRREFSEYFTIEGEEHLRKAYDRGKGVLCLVPHTSGWEFSAIMPPVLGYETSAVSRVIKNKPLNKLMIGLREKRRMKNISRQKGVYSHLTEILSKGECLIIMIDQDSKKVKGEFLTFFGREAYTPLGCARLAMDTGATIVPMATFRQTDDRYLFKILPEVPLELTGEKEYDLRHNTQRHNDVIESLIRLYPSQWVWMHERWRTTRESLAEYRQKNG